MGDIREKGLKKPVTVAEYLFRRLHEIGIRSVHGVPGDFNLVALDYIPKAGLRWVGSVNELNAGEYEPPRSSTQHDVLSIAQHTLPTATPG
jgi:hypothetical protein